MNTGKPLGASCLSGWQAPIKQGKLRSGDDGIDMFGTGYDHQPVYACIHYMRIYIYVFINNIYIYMYCVHVDIIDILMCEPSGFADDAGQIILKVSECEKIYRFLVCEMRVRLSKR